MEYELYHHGTKGMRWGVRRYQNKDGSLTAAGRKRYARETQYMNEKQAKKHVANPDKWVKEDLERTKRLADAGSNLNRELSRVNDNAIKYSPKTKMDLSSMSDKDMRDQINRALLERQYNEMFAPQNTSRGRETATKILETAGSVLAVGSSALGIALAIKELTG